MFNQFDSLSLQEQASTIKALRALYAENRASKKALLEIGKAAKAKAKAEKEKVAKTKKKDK